MRLVRQSGRHGQRHIDSSNTTCNGYEEGKRRNRNDEVNVEGGCAVVPVCWRRSSVSLHSVRGGGAVTTMIKIKRGMRKCVREVDEIQL